jgi:hypothetical protein
MVASDKREDKSAGLRSPAKIRKNKKKKAYMKKQE